MRHINLKTWPRREHFRVLSAWDYPNFINPQISQNTRSFIRRFRRLHRKFLIYKIHL